MIDDRIRASESMPKKRPDLTGIWEKIDVFPTGLPYPDRIVFQENGLYFGQKEPPGTYTEWDVGKFEVEGETRVRLSTANDAIITYEFSLEGDVLTFVDAEQHQLKYRRVK